MAGLLRITSRVLRLSQTIASSSKNNLISQTPSPISLLKFNGSLVSNVYNPVTFAVRHTSFFNRCIDHSLFFHVHVFPITISNIF